LRTLSKENLSQKAHLFPVKDALLYIQADPLGLDGTGFQGHNMWAAQNPSFGATFTLHIKDVPSTLVSTRQQKEKELEKEKKDVKVYSVYTLHEGEKYLKYIAEKGLNDWINVYDGAHLNNVVTKYDVYSTPVIYLLDKNKKIKAKRIGVEQIKTVIQAMEKEYQLKK
jgi:hypothetical protein